jgi:hypothetical protein
MKRGKLLVSASGSVKSATIHDFPAGSTGPALAGLT